MTKFTITIYKVSPTGDTTEVCWNEYNSVWLGRAYTTAWARRLGCDTISHVCHKPSGRTANFVGRV